MSNPRIGSLFSGYGGLDIGVAAVTGGHTAWVSDIDPGACKILAHRFPGIPNLGDITTVKWTPDCPSCGEPTALYLNDDMPGGRGYHCTTHGWWDLSLRLEDYESELIPEPVDILCGGFPCQDVSAAGKRAGIRHGTRSGLWLEFARAIDAMHPSLVVIENVRGLLSARGDEPTDDHLRAEAAARACTNLMEWLDTRHTRAVREGRTNDARHIATHRGRVLGCRKRALARAKWHERRLVRAIGTVLGSLADLGYHAAWHGLPASQIGAPHGRFRIFILAWPADTTRDAWWVSHGDDTTTPDPGGEERPRRTGLREGTPGGVGRGRPGDSGGPDRLLPTPRAGDGEKGGPNQRGSSGDLMLPSAVHQLMPPPTARDWKDGSPADVPENALLGRVVWRMGDGRLLPTPVTTDSESAARHSTTGDASHPGHARNLGEEIRATAGQSFCLKCRCPDDLHDGGGFCAGPCGGACGGRNTNITLLPTPAVNDMGEGKTVEGWDSWTDEMKAKHANGNGHGKSLAIEAQRLLPTPRVASDRTSHSAATRRDSMSGPSLSQALEIARGELPHEALARWGDYAWAVARWEALTQPAPDPTELGPNGNPRLSPKFSEWMMGVIAGWITDVPDLSRVEMLKAAGNGVVPQQAAYAVWFLLAVAARTLPTKKALVSD